MNIFILDADQFLSAQYHCDRHINSQLKEAVQILSTVCRLNGIEEGYHITHKNHPCTIWAGTNRSNFNWLKSFIFALNSEWKYRYGHERNHKSYEVGIHLSIPHLPNGRITPFVQAMPDDCKHPNAIEAYRNYYLKYKQHLWNWKNRPIPWWILKEINNEQTSSSPSQ
jgi:hypothetical protein